MDRIKNIVLSPGGISLADQAMVSGCNLLQAILLGRLMGMEAFGAFTLAWLGVLLASSLQQALILTPMLSLGPVQDKSKSYFEATIEMQWLFQIIAFIVLGVLGFFLSIGLALPLAGLAFLAQEYTRRRAFTLGKMAKAFWVDFLAYPGMIAGVIVLHFSGQLDISHVLYVIALSFGIATVTGGFIAQTLTYLEGPKEETYSLYTFWKMHLQFGSWLAGTAILQYFGGNAFLIAGGLLLGNTALGLIRAIQSLMGLLHVLLLAAEHLIPAQAAKAYADKGLHGLKHFLSSIFGIQVILPILLILALILAKGDWIIQAVFGIEEQIPSGLILLFILSYVGTITCFPLRIALRSISHTRPFFLAYAASAIMGLALAQPLIVSMGILGVPMGFCLSQALTFLFLFLSWRKAENALLKAVINN